MSTPEGKVKDAVRKVLKAHAPVWYYMPVPSGYGLTGVPDFVVCANGRFFVIECKANGAKVTALQHKTMTDIHNAGGVAIVVDDSAEVAAILPSYLNMLGCHAITP